MPIADRQPSEDQHDGSREREDRFRLLVEGIQAYAIFMLDPTGHVVTWNAGAERLKGYRAEEIIDKHVFNVLPAGSAGQEASRA